jgi:hypothetical protein
VHGLTLANKITYAAPSATFPSDNLAYCHSLSHRSNLHQTIPVPLSNGKSTYTMPSRVAPVHGARGPDSTIKRQGMMRTSRIVTLEFVYNSIDFRCIRIWNEASFLLKIMCDQVRLVRKGRSRGEGGEAPLASTRAACAKATHTITVASRHAWGSVECASSASWRWDGVSVGKS